jgi:hypothetical protein
MEAARDTRHRLRALDDWGGEKGAQLFFICVELSRGVVRVKPGQAPG